MVRDRRLIKLPVWIGQNDGVRTEVLSGLEIDDLVVSQTHPAQRLREGELTEVRLEIPVKDDLAGATPAR